MAEYGSLLPVSEVCYFLLLSISSWYESTTTCLTIHPLKGIWVVSRLGYHKQSCYEHLCGVLLCVHKLFFSPLGSVPKSAAAGFMVALCLVL